jgi:hypothetical protein
VDLAKIVGVATKNGCDPKFLRTLCTHYALCPTFISHRVGNYALVANSQ